MKFKTQRSVQDRGYIFQHAVTRRMARRAFLKCALATAPLLIAGPTLLLPKKTQAAPESSIGPNTTTEPYLVPSVPGVKFISILTVGDAIGNYRMVGIPDGLGAFNSGKGNFTLLMNHEITAARPGIVRAHGSNGAFVSRWTIDRKSLKVIKGEDLTPSPNHVYLWDSLHEEFTQGTTQWQRLCSADLPAESALFAKSQGSRDRIFFDGEEVTEGRAWARITTGPHAGEAWQLPRLGRMAYENVVACPHPQDKTVVVLLDDSDLSTAATSTGFPSEVYVYIGRKVRHGHPIEQVGLINGSLLRREDFGQRHAGDRRKRSLRSGNHGYWIHRRREIQSVQLGRRLCPHRPPT